MSTTKTRKINFYSFITKQKDDKEDIRPAHILRDVINYIDKLSVPNRKHDCSGSKFCYLEHIEEKEETEMVKGNKITYHIFKLFFVSAKHSYSAPLIDRATVKKRKNPKMLTEGEVQKTHLTVKFTTDDIMVCFERNGSGVSIQQVADYFKKFTKKYHEDILGHKPDFLLAYQT